MNRKRWIVILWYAAVAAILAASIVFKWHRWIDLPTGAHMSLFSREPWVSPSTLVANLSGLLSFFLISLVFYFFLPRTVRSIGQAPARKGEFLRAALLGFLASLLVFITILSAVLSNSTFPFAVVVTVITLLAGLIGMVALELRLGAWLASLAGWDNASAMVHLLLAVLALYPLTFLPAIGGLMMMAYLLLGLGAVVLSRVNALYPWNHESPDLEKVRPGRELME